MTNHKIYIGDALKKAKTLPSNSVHCIITSPPYWGLRDYGIDKWEGGDSRCKHVSGKMSEIEKDKKAAIKKNYPTQAFSGYRKGRGDEDNQACKKCGAKRIKSQLGLETSPEEHIEKLVELFRELRRVLHPSGLLFINYGDFFWGGRSFQGDENGTDGVFKRRAKRLGNISEKSISNPSHSVLKPKDLVGMAWRVALALQADGWWLRSDIIWCLSENTYLYARTLSGEGSFQVKKLSKLKNVKLWNGFRWTPIVSWRKAESQKSIEFTMSSGERIQCTEDHRWPTPHGVVAAIDLEVGDSIKFCNLPEPEKPQEDSNFACILGIYLATLAKDKKVKVTEQGVILYTKNFADSRLGQLKEVIEFYKGKHEQHVRRDYWHIISKELLGIISEYTERDGNLSHRIFTHSNRFLEDVLSGFVESLIHDYRKCKFIIPTNHKIENIIRTICARLDLFLTLRERTAYPTNYDEFAMDEDYLEGEIRIKTVIGAKGNKRNIIKDIVVVEGQEEFWDLEVEHSPHLFALSSGVLSHNSKRNPMPESVTDRPTRSHEYVFMMAKSAKYFYDYIAVREQGTFSAGTRRRAFTSPRAQAMGRQPSGNEKDGWVTETGYRNLRTVWTLSTEPQKEKHYAAFPRALVKPMILAGTSQKGCCPECKAPWERIVENHVEKGWQPTCDCGIEETEPCVVLDPFSGSATVSLVAKQLGRNSIGIELNPEYVEIARRRIKDRSLRHELEIIKPPGRRG